MFWLKLYQNQLWLIDYRFAEAVSPFVLNAIREGRAIQLPEKHQLKTSEGDVLVEGRLSSFDVVVEMDANGEPVTPVIAVDGKPRTNGPTMNVAIIPLRGVVSKDAAPCDATPTTKDIGSWLRQAYADPNISAIVLHTDSPGGSVDGTEELAQVVAERNKPIVAWVDGLAASAAYWIVSQADSIYINQETPAWAGSIGVIATLVNQSKKLENEGLAVTMVRDSQAIHKAKLNSIEPIEQDTMDALTSDLDTIKSTFVGYVKKGRGERLKSKDVFTGKVYNGKESVALGLVDKVGTLQDAVNAAAKLAHKAGKNSNSNAQINSTPDMKINFKSAIVLAAILGFEAKDEEVELNSDHIAKLEAHITGLKTGSDTLEASLAQAQSDLTTANGKVTTLAADLDTANAKVQNLENWKAENEGGGERADDATNDNGKKKTDAAYQKNAMAFAEKYAPKQ
jgi:protease-4